MPNQAAPCRFYALGHCQKGSACTFSHSNEKQVCQFYLAGNCSYGSKCVNKHDKSFKKVGISSKQNTSTAIKSKPVVPISVPPKQSKQSAWGKNSNQDTSNRTQNPSSNSETLLCPFKKSDCKWGINCKSIHGDICPSCDLPVLDPTNPSSHQTHLDSCKNSLQLNDQDQECVVCYEAVKKDGKGVFGLLDCVHVACYGCISQWRGVEKQVGSKTCPICRTITYFVVPSEIWPKDEEEKEGIKEEYKLKLSKVDCKHYKKGQGTCPFGTSCFYRHLDEYGVSDKDKTRIISAADYDETGLKVMTTSTLFDYLKLE